MRIVEQGERSETYGGRFTGRVELEMLQPAEADDRPDVARVHFFAGAVSNWHSHPGGQHLYSSRAAGASDCRMPSTSWRRASSSPRPRARRHYHGAARGADCVWLAITWGVTDWEDRAPEPA